MPLPPPAQHGLDDGVADAGGHRAHQRLGERLAVALAPAGVAAAHQDVAPAVVLGLLGRGRLRGALLQDLVGRLAVDRLLVFAVYGTFLDEGLALLGRDRPDARRR